MSCCSSDDRSSLKSSTAHLCQKWAEMSWSQKLSTFTIKTGCVRFSRLARGNIKFVTIKETSTNFLPKALCLSPSQSGKHAVAFRSAGSEPCLETLSADCFKKSTERSEVELFLVLRILRVILSCGCETHKN